MQKLDYKLLNQVKQAFVPQGGMAEPVAGSSQMTQGMAAPVGGGGDPAAQGGDPNAQPAPMPPSGMDPAMAGMVGGGEMAAGGPAPSGSSTITIDEMIKLFKLFKGQEGAPAAAPAQSGDPRLDHIITLLQGANRG